jgi:hypothetical protein
MLILGYEAFVHHSLFCLWGGRRGHSIGRKGGAMMYQIHSVTISRTDEDRPPQMYTYNTELYVQDIKAERKRVKEQFQADHVMFVYSEIPKDAY